MENRGPVVSLCPSVAHLKCPFTGPAERVVTQLFSTLCFVNVLFLKTFPQSVGFLSCIYRSKNPIGSDCKGKAHQKTKAKQNKYLEGDWTNILSIKSKVDRLEIFTVILAR